MAKFKVKSRISHGTRNAKGEVEVKDYEPGDSIDLTPEEAVGIRHALEKAPMSVGKTTKEDAEVAQSIIDDPRHPDSGVQADWKVDKFAQDTAVGVVKASQIEPGKEPEVVAKEAAAKEEKAAAKP